MAAIENGTLIPPVQDPQASRDYYIRTLGSSFDCDADAMISVSRDGSSIMVCQARTHRSIFKS